MDLNVLMESKIPTNGLNSEALAYGRSNTMELSLTGREIDSGLCFAPVLDAMSSDRDSAATCAASGLLTAGKVCVGVDLNGLGLTLFITELIMTEQSRSAYQEATNAF